MGFYSIANWLINFIEEVFEVEKEENIAHCILYSDIFKQDNY